MTSRPSTVVARLRPLRRDRSGHPSAAALLAAVILAIVLAGCGGATGTPTPAPSIGLRAEGIVVDIVSSGPVGVSRFTIRTSDGGTMEFDVGTLEVGGGAFPAEHLGEHRLSAEPVAVLYRDEGGRHVAYRLEDASGGSAVP